MERRFGKEKDGEMGREGTYWQRREIGRRKEGKLGWREKVAEEVRGRERKGEKGGKRKAVREGGEGGEGGVGVGLVSYPRFHGTKAAARRTGWW